MNTFSFRNYRISTFVLVALGLLSLAACDQTDLSEGGVFTYTANDSSGVALVTGMMDLEFGEPDPGNEEIEISGTWQLQESVQGAAIGPQTGNGELKGSIDDTGTLLINLNPDWADNNVFLAGRFTGGRFGDFDGTWSYSTFIGPVAGGTFTATRN